MEILQSHPAPDMGHWTVDLMHRFPEREIWTDKRGMYAFVCWDWVNPLTEWIGKRKVLEIMAGAGWLAKALRSKGIDVIATDDHSWIDEKRWPLQTEVERLSALKALKKYGRSVDIVICSWPYMNNDAYHALRLLGKINPAAIFLYIGEWEGGCTASNKFFEHYGLIEQEQFKKVTRAYKSWWCMHDRIYLGRYV